MEKAQKGMEYHIELPGGQVLKSATVTDIVTVGSRHVITQYIAVHHTVDTEGKPVDKLVRVPIDAKFTKLSGAEA